MINITLAHWLREYCFFSVTMCIALEKYDTILLVVCDIDRDRGRISNSFRKTQKQLRWRPSCVLRTLRPFFLADETRRYCSCVKKMECSRTFLEHTMSIESIVVSLVSGTKPNTLDYNAFNDT